MNGLQVIWQQDVVFHCAKHGGFEFFTPDAATVTASFSFGSGATIGFVSTAVFGGGGAVHGCAAVVADDDAGEQIGGVDAAGVYFFSFALGGFI